MINLNGLEQLLLISSGVVLLICLIALFSLLKRPLNAALTLLVAIPVLGGLLIVTQDIFSYRSLADDERIARVFITAEELQRYNVTLDLPGNETRHFMLKGDQWRLEGRVLRWDLTLAQLGVSNLVRLERLSNRYADISDEQSLIKIDYALPNSAIVDTWPILQHAQFLLNWVDVDYGSGVFAPLVDGAAYNIYLGRSGIFLRPENPIAVKALQDWST